MRTNIDIDDELMQQAIEASGAPTKKAAVEAALRQMVQLKKQERIGRWFGKIQWEGDLEAMRTGQGVENSAPPVRLKRKSAPSVAAD